MTATVERRLTRLTRAELAHMMEAGARTAIVPLGACEQHGDALPFGTDTMIARRIGQGLAEAINAVVAPAVPVGCSPEHAAVPGTLTVGSLAFITYVSEICRSLVDGGFTAIILLVGHFGNRGPAVSLAQDLSRECEAVIAVSDYFSGSEQKIIEAMGHSVEDFDWSWFYGHAGAGEAALVASVDEGLLDLDRAQGFDPSVPTRYLDAAMTFPQRIEETTPTGGWGHPGQVVPGVDASVTAELGDRLVEISVSTLAEKFRWLLANAPATRGAAR